MTRVEFSEFMRRLGKVIGSGTFPSPVIHFQFLLREDDAEFSMGKTWGLDTYVYCIGESGATWSKSLYSTRRTEWKFENMKHEVLEVLPPRRSVLRNGVYPTLRIS